MSGALKRRVHDGMAQLLERGVGSIHESLAKLYEPEAIWRGSHPLNEMGLPRSPLDYGARFSRRFPIVSAGNNC